jgi:excisionase family DNA binding protein
MGDGNYEPPDGYLTLFQALERLGVSRPTMQRMVRRGDLEIYRDPSNRRVRLVKVADVEHLLRPVPEGKAAA